MPRSNVHDNVSRRGVRGGVPSQVPVPRPAMELARAKFMAGGAGRDGPPPLSTPAPAPGTLPPMATITVSETVNAPLATVFQTASDIPNAAGRVKGIDKIEVLTPAPPAPPMVGKGFTWRETRTMFGRPASETMTITEWRPPHAYTVEARSHGCHYRTPFTFEELGPETTRMTMTFQATPETFMAKVMMKIFSFMTKQMAKLIHQDLKDIKAACESSAQ